uniref:Uncharacterized protein n=1 Tax=Romanomermis culicivorax TaxID=13658 RepID=A0A915KSP7_ROMCU
MLEDRASNLCVKILRTIQWNVHLVHPSTSANFVNRFNAFNGKIGGGYAIQRPNIARNHMTNIVEQSRFIRPQMSSVPQRITQARPDGSKPRGTIINPVTTSGGIGVPLKFLKLMDAQGRLTFVRLPAPTKEPQLHNVQPSTSDLNGAAFRSTPSPLMPNGRPIVDQGFRGAPVAPLPSSDGLQIVGNPQHMNAPLPRSPFAYANPFPMDRLKPMTMPQQAHIPSRFGTRQNMSMNFKGNINFSRPDMNFDSRTSMIINNIPTPTMTMNPAVGVAQDVTLSVPPKSSNLNGEDARNFFDSLQPETSEELDDDEELGQAETYAEYMPEKLKSGLPHPDPVVETSSLASVSPPDVHYHVCIPEATIDSGKLSALQLEAIIYACQKHEKFNPNGERCGYLIGDGAGVGKGRTIAGLIFENYLLGRKRALWFSVSSDLKYDAERDLADIGAGKIKVHALNKFKYTKISGKENNSVKKGVIFATYSSLIGESNNAKSKYRTRLRQLVHWCGGKDFDGLIIFDECHRAKNLMPLGSSRPTKTAQTVLELQQALPHGRVVYASATGATETRNMAYMTRLGLWGKGTQFSDFQEFISAVEKRGVGAMEIVAMDMKQRGLYIARQLSFAGTSFRVEEVPLNKEFVHAFDESVKLWLEARKQFQAAAWGLEKLEQKHMWAQFWSSHQRFFKYLCIAAKVQTCVRIAREAVKNGKCVVIGLQSTGEARTLEQLDECGGELNDFVSTAKSVFLSLIERQFPIPNRMKDSKPSRSALRELKNAMESVPDYDTYSETVRRTTKKRRDFDLPGSASNSKRLKFDEEISSDEESASESSKNGDFSDDDSTSSIGLEGTSSTETDDSNNEDEEDINPFADDDDDQDAASSFFSVRLDAWEVKLKKRRIKKAKKRRQHGSESEEEFDELGKQLELAFEEKLREGAAANIVVGGEKKTEMEQKDVGDFLKTSSSFFETEEAERFGSSIGISQAHVIKAELLAAVERLGDLLPPNTLDQLIDELGGPEYVAEMTGRKGRVVSLEDGGVKYELRHEDDVPLELMNLAEKERFMNGTKHIAIISEAASSGISLQSDRRAKNQRRRVHITLELPWSADKAIQQFGRSHRSNQVNAPEYVFLISELAGEYRFASIVAKRLESLGALTHGDRRATESRDLSQFNLDTKYGRVALDVVLKSIIGHLPAPVPPPTEYKSNFLQDMRYYTEGVGLTSRDRNADGTFQDNWFVEKDVNMAKFLNRILGLPVHAQNGLFQYFADTFKAVVSEAKRDGRYDLGILDLGSLGHERVKKLETKAFIGKPEAGGFKTELHQLLVERGLSWEEAIKIFNDHDGEGDGFYVTSTPNSRQRSTVLICAVGRRRLGTNERLYNVFKPNTGLNPNMETMAALSQRFKKTSVEAAEPLWRKQYTITTDKCQHYYFFGRCRNEQIRSCDAGKRLRSYYVLSGSVLSVWNTVESVLCGFSTAKRPGIMQIVRVRTEKNQKIVGILIPNIHVKNVVSRLTDEASRTYVEC